MRLSVTHVRLMILILSYLGRIKGSIALKYGVGVKTFSEINSMNPSLPLHVRKLY